MVRFIAPPYMLTVLRSLSYQSIVVLYGECWCWQGRRQEFLSRGPKIPGVWVAPTNLTKSLDLHDNHECHRSTRVVRTPGILAPAAAPGGLRWLVYVDGAVRVISLYRVEMWLSGRSRSSRLPRGARNAWTAGQLAAEPTRYCSFSFCQFFSMKLTYRRHKDQRVLPLCNLLLVNC